MGKVPSGSTAATWSGSGDSWFKIAEWGATYPNGDNSAMSFADYNDSQLSATIPKDIPNGDYLIKIEQIALHVVGAPQWYTSCAQVTVTGGSGATTTFVNMPAYSSTDPCVYFHELVCIVLTRSYSGLTVDIYDEPAPSPYLVSKLFRLEQNPSLTSSLPRFRALAQLSELRRRVNFIEPRSIKLFNFPFLKMSDLSERKFDMFDKLHW